MPRKAASSMTDVLRVPHPAQEPHSPSIPSPSFVTAALLVFHRHRLDVVVGNGALATVVRPILFHDECRRLHDREIRHRALRAAHRLGAARPREPHGDLDLRHARGGVAIVFCGPRPWTPPNPVHSAGPERDRERPRTIPGATCLAASRCARILAGTRRARRPGYRARRSSALGPSPPSSPGSSWSSTRRLS